MSKEVSQGFQVTNLIATILVVAIHYNSKHHIDYSVDTLNYLIQEFITNGIARIAVPFFALSAGIFFFLNYENVNSYVNNLKKRFSSILIPYLLASMFIYISHILYLQVFLEQSYPVTLYGLCLDIFLKPLSAQFWFLRDLLALAIVSPVIFFLCRRIGAIFILILFISWLFNINILPYVAERHFIAIETLFFFSLGCYLIVNKIKVDSLFLKSNLFTTMIFLCFLASMVVRVYIEPNFRISRNIYTPFTILLQNIGIIIGVYSLILVSSKIKNKSVLYLSSFTFFVFLYHALPISRVIIKTSDYLIADPYKFYLTFPFVIVAIFSFAIIFEKLFPKIYRSMTGARDSRKVMARAES